MVPVKVCGGIGLLFRFFFSKILSSLYLIGKPKLQLSAKRYDSLSVKQFIDIPCNSPQKKLFSLEFLNFQNLVKLFL